MQAIQQLLPGFSFRRDCSFDNFYCNDDLQFVCQSLKNSLQQERAQQLFLFGAAGSGKSHLLQALCNESRQALYLPLKELRSFPAQQVLDGALEFDCICLDDVDQIGGDEAWQEAIFHLYNQCFMNNKSLCFSAQKPARQLNLGLADLQSRLSLCLAFYLPPFDDGNKLKLLQFLAKRRGFEINQACAVFIIQHCHRDNEAIIAVLKQLDEASLLAKRKITIPFIKQLMQW